MEIHDDKTFTIVSQLFLLVALFVNFAVYFYLKHNKIEFTYKIAFRLIIFVLFPIVSFPFLLFSSMDLLTKFIGAVFALSAVLLQFFGTMAFHKAKNKLFSKTEK